MATEELCHTRRAEALSKSVHESVRAVLVATCTHPLAEKSDDAADDGQIRRRMVAIASPTWVGRGRKDVSDIHLTLKVSTFFIYPL